MEIIAKCGNRCDLCPAYRENIARHGAETVSENWKRYLGFTLPPDEIACDGCLNEGYRPAGDCGIRKCCTEKAYGTCANCAEMPCEKLQRNIAAMDALEKAQGDIPIEVYELYFRPYQNREVLMRLKARLGSCR